MNDLKNVQKVILKFLLRLYEGEDSEPVKGDKIAEAMNRSPGTIRNHMMTLKDDGYVKAVPGPKGGYIPSSKTFEIFNLTEGYDSIKLPVLRNGNRIDNVVVNGIKFTNFSNNRNQLIHIQAIGDINQFKKGDKIRVGPSVIHQLKITGTVIGVDESDDIIMITPDVVLSVPKLMVSDLCSYNPLTTRPDDNIYDATRLLTNREFRSAPVVDDDGKLLGMISIQDMRRSIANNPERNLVKDVMNSNIGKISESSSIVTALENIYEQEESILIVVDEYEKPVGILSRADFAKIYLS